MPKNAKALASEIQGMWDAAEREGRDLEPDERAHMEQLIESAKSMHRIEQQIREVGGGGFSFVTKANGGPADGGPGEQFVVSQGYKAIREASGRGRTWTTGLADCRLVKGTLLEGSGAPGSGTGGGFAPVPQVVPGVVDKLFQDLSVEDLLLAGQASLSRSYRRGRMSPRLKVCLLPQPGGFECFFWLLEPLKSHCLAVADGPH